MVQEVLGGQGDLFCFCFFRDICFSGYVTSQAPAEARRDDIGGHFCFSPSFLLDMPISGISSGIYHIDVGEIRESFVSYSLDSTAYHSLVAAGREARGTFRAPVLQPDRSYLGNVVA